MNHGYASVWKRFAAYFIDCAILSVIAGLGWLLDIITSWDDLLSFSPILLLVSWLYFSLLESSPMQATIGKKLLGLQVDDLEGDAITFVTATIRYFSKFLSTAAVFGGYIMAFFTEKHQGLHDILAKTVVIDTTAVSAPAPAPSNDVASAEPAPAGETPLFSPPAPADPNNPLAGFGKGPAPKEPLFLAQNEDPKWLTSFGEMTEGGEQTFHQPPEGTAPQPPVTPPPPGMKLCQSCGATVGKHQTKCHKCKATLKKEKGMFW